MKPQMKTNEVLRAEAVAPVSSRQAKEWFLSLGEHPERYRFETHEGFSFTRGSFAEIGARFETREAFGGLRIKLRFELTEVGETAFTFRQYAPIPGVWGRFSIMPTESGETRIRLSIGGENWLARMLLKLPVISLAVKRQIRAEVQHIAHAMAEQNSPTQTNGQGCTGGLASDERKGTDYEVA